MFFNFSFVPNFFRSIFYFVCSVIWKNIELHQTICTPPSGLFVFKRSKKYNRKSKTVFQMNKQRFYIYKFNTRIKFEFSLHKNDQNDRKSLCRFSTNRQLSNILIVFHPRWIHVDFIGTEILDRFTIISYMHQISHLKKKNTKEFSILTFAIFDILLRLKVIVEFTLVIIDSNEV